MGAPGHCRSRTASCSVMPGRRPHSSRLMPSDVWQAAYSMAASCSGSLTARRPAAGSVKMSPAFSTRPRAHGGAERIDDEGWRLQPVAIGLASSSPRHRHGCRQRCLRRQRTSASERAGGRGMPARLRSGASSTRIGSGARLAMPTHSMPVSSSGSPAVPTMSSGFLEAWIETGEPGQVGTVLAVRVDDEGVVATLAAAVARALQSSTVQLRRQHGHALGSPKSGRSMFSSLALDMVTPCAG